ncbi:coniferyl aldehyde dehydrogenase [Shewanella sp. GXUN23E]|uniref:coniferyl aldehyde dehydrogenase n=1 Tax=Shewanella sp. GXUN23E TaxID=3422498 RepID=UPI003D7D0EA8
MSVNQMGTSIEALNRQLTTQRQAHRKMPVTDAAQRRAQIQSVIDMLVAGHCRLVDAMETDFGGRHRGFSLMNDILGSMASLKHTRDNLGQWMTLQQRPVFSPYDQLGASAEVRFQAKGVVGIMGTWNAPIYTLLSPLACVLGAGNRAILKPSELTPCTAEVLAELIALHLDPEWISTVNGGPELGAAFAGAGFDHLMFTGSGEVGKKVMTAAAQQLTPVTLELGGKSPAIISRQGDMMEYCRRLAIAKGTNGGQICVSPDILYVPVESKDAVIDALLNQFRRLYPTVTGNGDLTPIINDRHLERIESLLADARDRGITLISSHGDEVGADRRLGLTLVLEPAADAKVMQQEIFGPLLIIKGYQQISEVIEDINSRSNPLALYWFGDSDSSGNVGSGEERDGNHVFASELELVLAMTRSGGVTVNDALLHAAMHDAPFGGTGHSGMGHYHGREGFLTFSHMKTVLTSPGWDPRAEWGMLPPYHEGFEAVMASQVVAD